MLRQKNRSEMFSCILLLLAAFQLTGNTEISALGAEPATVDQARKVIDLSKFPIVGNDALVSHRVMASQSYTAKGSVAEISKAITKKLQAENWKEDAGATVTDQYASSTLKKDGFILSVSVMPGQPEDRVMVNLANIGNVDFKALPVPKGMKEIYIGPTMAMYQIDGKAADVIKQLQNLLKEKGWTSFGDALGSFYMRKNAVKLLVSVTEQPGQSDKSSVQFSSELLSQVFPVPPEVVMLQNTDSTGRILLDTKLSKEATVSFFKDALAKDGWKVTTDEPVRIDFWDHFFFVNAKKESIDMHWYEVDGNTRVELEYQTAERVAELNALAKKVAAEAKQKLEMEASRPVQVAKIRLPKLLNIKEESKTEVEATAKSGDGKKIIEEWLGDLKKDGWTATANVSEKILGDFVLKKDGIQLHLNFTDPGFIPANFSLSVFGKGELEIIK